MQDLGQLESTHMDRLTQTQDAIDDLVKIMYSTLSYLTRKANFKQLNPDIPITQTIPNAEPPDVFEANQKELVADFVRKAKQLEYLISVLPSTSTSSSTVTSPNSTNPRPTVDESELEALEMESQEVNKEYLEALGEAETLHDQLQASLRKALEARSSRSATISATPNPATAVPLFA